MCVSVRDTMYNTRQGRVSTVRFDPNEESRFPLLKHDHTFPAPIAEEETDMENTSCCKCVVL